MKLRRYKNNPILTNDKNVEWEAGSVFNPSVIKDEKGFHMFYRATNDIRKDLTGGYVSSIGYAHSEDGIHFTKREKPFISPTEEYEEGLGCEDARVTKIGDTYYIYYTAGKADNDDVEVRIALATSKDLVKVQKHGIVGPKGSWTKAATLFPETFNGKYLMIYTWEADSTMSTIMSVWFDSLKHLKNPPPGFYGNSFEYFDTFYLIHPLKGSYRGPEVGAPPVKTKDGWLLIYCGSAVGQRIWTIDAMLLDLENPYKILGIIPNHILEPEVKSEKEGVVNNVTFPSGAVIVGEELYVYYGSGDQGCCLATCKLDDLLNQLMKNPPSKKMLGQQFYRQERFQKV